MDENPSFNYDTVLETEFDLRNVLDVKTMIFISIALIMALGIMAGILAAIANYIPETTQLIGKAEWYYSLQIKIDLKLD